MREGLCKTSSKRQVLLEGAICKAAKEEAAKSDHVQEEKAAVCGDAI